VTAIVGLVVDDEVVIYFLNKIAVIFDIINMIDLLKFMEVQMVDIPS
jgi:hypothetical protein